MTSIAGTTRDSIHTRYNKFGMDFYLVDTAGMRKKGKAMEDLEFYSVMRSIRAIENSDVCILMLDAQQGLESQDLNIHNLIVRNRKGCVIVVNKWDLIEKDNNTMKEWTEFLKKKLAPFNDIPIIFTSVLSKQRIFDVLQTAIRVYQSRKRRISTSGTERFPAAADRELSAPATKGKYIKIKYVTQLPTPTPQFAFFRKPAAVHQRSLTAGSSKTTSATTGISPGCRCRFISGRSKTAAIQGYRTSFARRNPEAIFLPSPPLTEGDFFIRNTYAGLFPAEIKRLQTGSKQRDRTQS